MCENGLDFVSDVLFEYQFNLSNSNMQFWARAYLWDTPQCIDDYQCRKRWEALRLKRTGKHSGTGPRSRDITSPKAYSEV